MKYFVTIPACEERLRARIKPDDNILVLQPYKPIYSQIGQLPPEADIIASPPAEWTKHAKEDFAERVSQATISQMISRNTVGHFYDQWARNLIQNYEAVYDSIPVDRIKNTGPATIYGNGPSLDPSIQHGTIYASWHCVKRIKKAHYIGHLDANPIEPAEYLRPEYGILACPTAAPTFFKTYANEPRFVYYSSGCALEMHMAEKMGHPGHKALSCSVTDLLVITALMAGHTEIHFSGLDLSMHSLPEAQEYNGNHDYFEADGIHGKVWTSIAWEKYRTCLEGLIQQHPDVTFINHSKGLLIEGAQHDK